MPLNGSLTKNSDSRSSVGTTASNASTGVSGGGAANPLARVQGAQEFNDANSVQGLAVADTLLERTGFDANTANKVKTSIAMNIAQNGQAAVLDGMRDQMLKFQNYRKSIVDAYSVSGQELPSELSEQLDALEDTTGNRILFQMMEQQGAAQLTNTFNPEQLIASEGDLLAGINEFASPALQSQNIIKQQKSLADLSNVYSIITERGETIKDKKRQNEETLAFGELDTIYGASTLSQLNSANHKQDWLKLGVPRSVFGAYINKRKGERLDELKDLAAINATRASTNAARNKLATDKQALKSQSILDNASDDDLAALQAAFETRNQRPLPDTASVEERRAFNNARKLMSSYGADLSLGQIVEVRSDRAKQQKEIAGFTDPIAEGVASMSLMESMSEELDSITSFVTGSDNTRFSNELLLGMEENAKTASNFYAVGSMQYSRMLATSNTALAAAMQPKFEEARDGLLSGLGEEARALYEESFARNGAITYGDNVANVAAQNVGQFGTINSSHPLSEVGRTTSQLISSFADSQGFDIGAMSEKFAESPSKEFAAFLDAPAGIEGNKTKTNRQVIRTQYVGTIKETALRSAIDVYLEDGSKLQETIQNTFYDNQGNLLDKYKENDGHPDITGMMLDLQIRSVETIDPASSDFDAASLRAITPEVEAFRDLLLNTSNGGDDDLGIMHRATLDRLTRPTTQAEMVMQAIAGADGTTVVAKFDNGKFIDDEFISAKSPDGARKKRVATPRWIDINTIVGTDMRVDIANADAELQRFMQDAFNDSRIENISNSLIPQTGQAGIRAGLGKRTQEQARIRANRDAVARFNSLRRAVQER